MKEEVAIPFAGQLVSINGEPITKDFVYDGCRNPLCGSVSFHEITRDGYIQRWKRFVAIPFAGQLVSIKNNQRNKLQFD